MSLVKKHIQEPYFSLIYEGVKLAEGRVVSDFWNLDLLGQQFTLHNEVEEFDVLVTRVDAYYGEDKQAAIINMLQGVGIEVLLPTIDNFEEAVACYMGFGDAVTTRVAAFYLEATSVIRPYDA